MAGKRTRHARGSLALNKRASGEHVWIFRYEDAAGKYRGIQFATIKQCRTRSQARIEADRQRLPEKHIGPAQAARNGQKTFGQLVARYKEEEMPERFSTSHSGIPAHSAMNGTASRTLIHTMVVIVCSPFSVPATLPERAPGIRREASALVMNP